ncbi:NAD(P)-dependent oxidoreductase [Pseudarthrobacter niigatensis]|uniref:3-hydroxyisobutyrate dehydrogenase n=1 Tax=Pseudarthrobacter niigatensis TaxID=369935 RepID=A0AAJ1WEJ1_9MICC|nr:NAD(P)-dependent oxidoreductase [Pseudarthrobacter niigatensis]MDQ0144660.1 3-hydroxyisobutyrate dehydrogenase [Pseudarthrobacter niigatensis]MDQ0265306.1 3-hydroxyisobutyrate dehydrogenase [Pseudarthrobacter niigatensis]
MSDAAVGFIGLGNMGRPMVTLLANAGMNVVVFDASESVRQAAASDGLTVATGTAEIAATCETVILMLPSSDIVDSVVKTLCDEPGRLVSLIIDMSSSIPDRTVSLAKRCAGFGVAVVDAPVSGGVARAKTGDLTLMVGGAAADVERAHAFLPLLGSRIIHVGEVGAGHAVKALNNLLSATHLLATNEAVLAARKFGVQPSVFLDVVNTSSGRSGSSELKLPNYVLPGTFNSGFSASLLEKDVRIAVDLEHALEMEAPISEAVAARWKDLNSRLEAGADHTAIIRPMEQDLGLEVRAS